MYFLNFYKISTPFKHLTYISDFYFNKIINIYINVAIIFITINEDIRSIYSNSFRINIIENIQININKRL